MGRPVTDVYGAESRRAAPTGETLALMNIDQASNFQDTGAVFPWKRQIVRAMNGPYDTGSSDLETSVGYYLTRARQAFVERMDQALAPLGLTAQQIGVMLLLARGEAHTPLELSRRLAYDSGSMTRMLDRLERKGLLERSRSEADRRVIEIGLTGRGRDAADALPGLVAGEMNAQLAGFSADEVRTMTALLQRFIANTPA
jgi:DNA-binding MarR family transcriptional regulator